MSAYDIFRGARNDAAKLRAMAAEAEQRSQDSFDRCDTDGFLSQWANDITARQFKLQAEIVERGGRGIFSGLYDGDRRVKARMIACTGFRGRGIAYRWLLADEEADRYGRKFLPVGQRSRVLKQLGLQQRQELAPGLAHLGGSGKGLSGCTNAYVETIRTGDPWGLDAQVMP